MIISVNAKILNKIQHPLMIKTFSELRTKENVINLTKNIYSNLLQLKEL